MEESILKIFHDEFKKILFDDKFLSLTRKKRIKESFPSISYYLTKKLYFADLTLLGRQWTLARKTKSKKCLISF